MEIGIPVSVTSIEDYAFYNCTSLKDVYYSGTREEWEQIAIGSVANELLLNATIHYNSSESVRPDDRLSMLGAQIRVPSQGSVTEEQGLRFVSSIDVKLYETLQKPASASDVGLGFGTVVFPTKWLEEGELLTKETVKDGKGAMVVPAVKLFEAPNGSYATFTACMTGIGKDAASLTTAYTVVPYATYFDGEKEITVYGDQFSTSVFAIAKAAFESGREGLYISEYLYKEILHIVDPETYNEPQKWSSVYKP